MKTLDLLRLKRRQLTTLGAAVSLAAALLPGALHAAEAASAPEPADPHQWLEEVLGEKPLAWVKERNEASFKVLKARPEFNPIRQDLLGVLNARDRIPGVSRMGGFLYNLWQDEQHKRGLWRRTTLAEYQKADPAWETVLDLDALGAAEGESWVFHGAQCLGPSYRRCMVNLSRGGSDAQVSREFDTVTKQFIKGGFALPEAKSQLTWLDENTLFVGTDFGPGSLTDSGYPRVIKQWKRGTPLSDARTVFEGEAKDVAASVLVDRTPGHQRVLFQRALDFYTSSSFLLQGGKLVKLEIPDDVESGFWGPWMLLKPRNDWTVAGGTFKSGSLLITDLKAYQRGERKFKVLFQPTATRSLSGYSLTRSRVLLSVIDQVASKLEEWDFSKAQAPQHREVKAPFPGALHTGALYDSELPKDELAERYFLYYTDFLTPDTLFLARTGSDERQVLKSRQAQFDAAGMRAEQRFAISKDGTRVPYFVIWPKGATADGSNPTLLYGYGGFEVSLQPGYSGGRGRAWLSRGGVYVLANIRGGGEFGPAWHQAAIKANKQRSYEDFIAVAEDLVKAKITSPRHLGIMGGSNGGLLMGATFTQRPDLFNAVVCQVPLLDMRRFHKLLAGASWMAEYGNPDDAKDWEVIRQYSPYHNVSKDKTYPKVFFTTSTRDDRVHPGHARKMVARMTELGHEVYYYENTEGGHGGAADNEQRATLQALEYSYLWQQLGR